MNIQPVTLTGKLIRLEPLHRSHVEELTDAGKDKSIWRYLMDGPIYENWGMAALVHYLLDCEKQGIDLPFAVVCRETKDVIGCTRYLNIELHNRALEIGTWFSKDYQGTGVNTESKYLLLRHAFETLYCIRVQFKIDVRNEASIRAIERLGAIKEGEMRKHVILADGHQRTSALYSILDHEWPKEKAHIEALMARSENAAPRPRQANGAIARSISS